MLKKIFLITAAISLATVLPVGSIYSQPGGPDPRGGWYCPWMGQGPGGQEGGGWYCPWRGAPSGPPVAQPGKPLSKDQAKALVDQHIQSSRNPNLKIGPVVEKDGVYEVSVVTKDGSLVDKIQVNKQTGWFRSVY